MREHDDQAAAIAQYCLLVLDAVKDHVPAVKIQSACFERYGAAGAAVRDGVVTAARRHGLVTILDAKRGDIGISAEHYAVGAFGHEHAADWITVNAYLGADGLEPFLARGGAFALVRTSNPGGDALQQMKLENGRTVAEYVAYLMAELGDSTIGQSGYSALGAVVGATKADEAMTLRRIMPRQIFLVPGVGAQGGDVEALRGIFDEDGQGALITASRSVIYAFDDDQADWQAAVAAAAAELASTVGRVAGWQ